MYCIIARASRPYVLVCALHIHEPSDSCNLSNLSVYTNPQKDQLSPPPPWEGCRITTYANFLYKFICPPPPHQAILRGG